jgi:arylsulfatase
MNAAPKITNRSHSITADVDVPSGGSDGVLVSQGGIDGGYTFYVKGGKLQYLYNYVARSFYHVESKGDIPEGRHQLRYEFEVTGEPDILNGIGAAG